MEEILSHDIFLDKGDDPKGINMRYYLEGEKMPIGILPNFNRINVFVGANNSGKSWFMRYLMSRQIFTGCKSFEGFEQNLSDYISLVSNLKDNRFKFKINEHDVLTSSLSQEVNEYFLKQEIIRFEDLESVTPYREDIDPGFKSNYYSIQVLKTLITLLKENLDHDIWSFSILQNTVTTRIFIGREYMSSDDKSEILRLETPLLALDNLYIKIKDHYESVVYIGSGKHIYIPTLRSAHALFNKDKQKNEEDIFLDTLKHHYELKDIDVFTGIRLHHEILNIRNSKRSMRMPFEDFEKFLSKYFFGGQDIDIIAEFDKHKSLEGSNEKEIISVHIGDRTEDLHRLGDGIQALIILMYKIFMAETKTIIFIDEPELNLHPGMQRLFFEQISQNKTLLDKKLTYVISTHSNHFLDLTLEQEGVSIYSFTPRKKTENLDQKEFEIRNVHAGDKDMLEHLGVNTSSVFLANAGVWVEGISDRKYLRAFLHAYMEASQTKKRLREDLDYAFLEYAGSNVKHYIFDEALEPEQEVLIRDEIKAFALNNHIYLLADSDCAKKTTKKGKRLVALEALRSKHFLPRIIWEVREIENLLPMPVWKKVLINFCDVRKVDSETKRNEVQAKIDMALKRIQPDPKEYIGVFLNEVKKTVPELNKIYETKAEGSFGTFLEKAKLSDLVLQGVLSGEITWAVLSENGLIKELTEELYGFLKR